jgi:hypothetical protein
MQKPGQRGSRMLLCFSCPRLPLSSISDDSPQLIFYRGVGSVKIHLLIDANKWLDTELKVHLNY